MIYEALKNLGATAEWAVTNNDVTTLQWLTDGVKPSTQAIVAEISRLQAEYDAQAYARSRVQEYPPIGDQLDALFKAGVFPADMAAAIQAVKDKYPKGTA